MLFDSYCRLIEKFPAGCTHLFGQSIEGRLDLWLSVDDNEHPSLLFEAQESDEQPDIRLKSVEVDFVRHCEISVEGGDALSGTFTAIRFKEDDVDLVRIFLRLLEEAFLDNTDQRSSQAIRSKIIDIADVFRRLETSIKDVIGLWGELHVIRRSHDPARVARAWCLAKSAQFDFLGKDHAVEVKATTKQQRVHRFSMEQLRPSSGQTTYICSVLLVELPTGMTLGELIEEVLELIDDADDRHRVFHQCLLKGGKDIYSSTLSLSVFPNGVSTAVFDARTIPVPSVEDSAPIYNVKFDVDLSEEEPLASQDAELILSM